MLNHRHMLTLLQTGFTTIRVIFENNIQVGQKPSGFHVAENRQEYTYKAKLEDNIKEGDKVVVVSPRNGLVIVTVVGVDAMPKLDLEAGYSYKWIVQKVDIEAYNKQIEQEENFQQMLVECERAAQRDKMIESFRTTYPEGSEARRLFDEGLKNSGLVLPAPSLNAPQVIG